MPPSWANRPWGRRHGLRERNGFGPPPHAGGPWRAPGKALIGAGVAADGYSPRGRPGLTLPGRGGPIDLGTPDPFFVTTGPLVLPASGQIPTSVRFTSDSGYVITTLRMTSSDALAQPAVFITNESTGRPWMNRRIPLSLIAGNGRLPFELPVPDLVQTNGGLACLFSNLSATAATIRLEFEGFRLRSGRFGVEDIDVMAAESPWFYGVTAAMLAGVGTVNEFFVDLHDDADFELHHCNADDRTDYDVLIRTSSSGYVWSEQRLAAQSIFGEGQESGNLTVPLQMAAKDRITITTTNQQAGAQTAEMSFGGAKRWVK